MSENPGVLSRVVTVFDDLVYLSTTRRLMNLLERIGIKEDNPAIALFAVTCLGIAMFGVFIFLLVSILTAETLWGALGYCFVNLLWLLYIHIVIFRLWHELLVLFVVNRSNKILKTTKMIREFVDARALYAGVAYVGVLTAIGRMVSDYLKGDMNWINISALWGLALCLLFATHVCARFVQTREENIETA